jgi:hypothetical protein
MVATETIDDLKKKSARTVTVDFRAPVRSQPPSIAGVTVRSRSDRRWVLDVSGPLGALLESLSALSVHDLQIEPFRLEDYIAKFYGIDVGGPGSASAEGGGAPTDSSTPRESANRR